ncbi:MAG: hypothetical protein ACI9S8_003010 [Chlamydiales bacterium]|jgi:hypothetical protein
MEFNRGRVNNLLRHRKQLSRLGPLIVEIESANADLTMLGISIVPRTTSILCSRQYLWLRVKNAFKSPLEAGSSFLM